MIRGRIKDANSTINVILQKNGKGMANTALLCWTTKNLSVILEIECSIDTEPVFNLLTWTESHYFCTEFCCWSAFVPHQCCWLWNKGRGATLGLALHDTTVPTKVSTDALPHGLGAVPLQQIDSSWRPVSFASPCQRWSTDMHRLRRRPWLLHGHVKTY